MHTNTHSVRAMPQSRNRAHFPFTVFHTFYDLYYILPSNFLLLYIIYVPSPPHRASRAFKSTYDFSLFVNPLRNRFRIARFGLERANIRRKERSFSNQLWNIVAIDYIYEEWNHLLKAKSPHISVQVRILR